MLMTGVNDHLMCGSIIDFNYWLANCSAGTTGHTQSGISGTQDSLR